MAPPAFQFRFYVTSQTTQLFAAVLNRILVRDAEALTTATAITAAEVAIDDADDTGGGITALNISCGLADT